MAEVVLEAVSKTYPGGFRAVDNVSLHIEDRAFVVLVGPSGCGKSTTLRMVAGLEEISSGQIRIGPRVVNDVAPKDRNIAMVFQNYALYPHMDVYQNMAFGLRLRRRSGVWNNPVAWLFSGEYRQRGVDERREIDSKVRSAAQMLGIESLLKRRPRELSGGQRQRVAVGRAIVRAPQAYLFDEPLSNLDAKLRIEMRGEIKRLHRRVQTTTIYVTHDQEEAMTLGDRVVVMKDGIIHQVGAPLEIYDQPVNRFVAGFLGTPPMNFLEGRVRRDGDRLVFDEGEHRLPIAPQHQGLLARLAEQPVTLGARPECFSPGDVGAAATFQFEVSVVEPLGDRMDVRGGTAAHPNLICRLDARSGIRESTRVPMHLDMARVHYFAAQSDGAGRNLLRG